MNDIPQSTADLLRIPPTPNDVIQDGGEQRSVKPMADENNGDKIRTYTTTVVQRDRISPNHDI